jgi:hypothetical protein
LRLKGTTEAVQARAILAPLLAGQQIGTLTILHIAQSGTKVKQGDLLVEFVVAPMDGLVALEKNEGSTGVIFFSGMSLPECREGDQIEPGRTVGQVIDPNGMELVAKGRRARAESHPRRTGGGYSTRLFARNHVSRHGEERRRK